MGAEQYYKDFEIFHPHAYKAVTEIMNGQFIHYTSADTIQKIIQNREFWLRNARKMNDPTEIKHGLDCLLRGLESEKARKLLQLLKDFNPKFADVWNAVLGGLQIRVGALLENTYLASLGLYRHNAKDSNAQHKIDGEIPMWRMYGGAPEAPGAALVLNAQPILNAGGPIPIFSSHVVYREPDNFHEFFDALIHNVQLNQDYVGRMPSCRLLDRLLYAMCAAVVCTKSPYYEYEKEWRVVYWPNSMGSEEQSFQSLRSDEVELKDGLQKIYKLSLTARDTDELKIDLKTLLNSVLIGPYEDQEGVKVSLVKALRASGWSEKEAAQTVRKTKIPLRA